MTGFSLDSATAPTRDQLQEQLRAEQDLNLLLVEENADITLALEDKGWRALGDQVSGDFTADGRRALRSVCRTMAIANPLIKRGLTVRIGYIWGQGVQVRARAAAEDAQDINAVVQDWWKANAGTLTGSQQLEELERAVGTDGEVYLACFTDPLVGKVRIRTTPAEEITDIITNPQDRDEPWFYLRQWTEQTIEAGTLPGTTRTRAQTKKAVHPALGYRPATRIRNLNGAEVRWDAPILHVPVNRLDGWKHGIPDVYASVAWARAYKEFLTDWAGVVKALSKFSWRMSGGTRKRAQRAASEIRRNTATPAGVPPLNGHQVGQAAVGSDGMGHLEAIPKSGATIDADSGKPLAAMAAAGLGLPVTILLADPGTTGARAVAETLDLPTVLEMGMRRLMWQAKFTELIEYVIDQAAIAPRGPLRGSLARDGWGRQVVTLAGDVEKTLDWDWPALVETDPVQLVTSIVQASESDIGRAVPLQLLRLLLGALGVDNVDELLDGVTDEDGRWVDPQVSAGQVAVDVFRQGGDAAEALR